MKLFKTILGMEIVAIPLISFFLWMFHVTFVWLPILMVGVALYVIVSGDSDNEGQDENYCPETVMGVKKLYKWNGVWYSPYYKTPWINGELRIGGRLTTDGREGIYFVYDKNDPALDEYEGDKCLVEFTGYIPHERGGRAEYGRIVRVL